MNKNIKDTDFVQETTREFETIKKELSNTDSHSLQEAEKQRHQSQMVPFGPRVLLEKLTLEKRAKNAKAETNHLFLEKEKIIFVKKGSEVAFETLKYFGWLIVYVDTLSKDWIEVMLKYRHEVKARLLFNRDDAKSKFIKPGLVSRDYEKNIKKVVYKEEVEYDEVKDRLNKEWILESKFIK